MAKKFTTFSVTLVKLITENNQIDNFEGHFEFEIESLIYNRR